jgi:hypothetical protein
LAVRVDAALYSDLHHFDHYLTICNAHYISAPIMASKVLGSGKLNVASTFFLFGGSIDGVYIKTIREYDPSTKTFKNFGHEMRGTIYEHIYYIVQYLS